MLSSVSVYVFLVYNFRYLCQLNACVKHDWITQLKAALDNIEELIDLIEKNIKFY